MNLLTTAPVFALGFEFAEPATGGNGPGTCFVSTCIDSTFTVTLKIGAFQFNVADDTTGFVGVWSDAAFNSAEIRETTGGIDDEFYGQVYTSATAPVPVPAAVWLFGSAFGGLAFMRRRPS